MNQKPMLNLVKTYFLTFDFKSHLQSENLLTISTSMKKYQANFKNN